MIGVVGHASRRSHPTTTGVGFRSAFADDGIAIERAVLAIIASTATRFPRVLNPAGFQVRESSARREITSGANEAEQDVAECAHVPTSEAAPDEASDTR